MKDTIKALLKDIWNIPNILTIFRLILVPVFAVLLMTGHSMQALIVFCVASLTDALDGFIARKYHLITAFGKLMDPLADKLLVVTALILQGIRGVLPWTAIGISTFKELLMVIGGMYMLKKNIVVQANYFGKIATVFFMAALIASFFCDWFVANAWAPLHTILLWISVGLSLLALASYIIRGIKQLKTIKQ